ncbi:MAG: DcrB-related protein [Akkermansiaceae bacterium]|nr:DcrB-related protein [Armatimonadota bacterium]
MTVVASFVAPCHAQESIRSTEAGFTLPAPKGWKVTEIAGLKYKVAVGKPANGFAPNIVIVDEAFGGTVNAYAEVNKKNAAKFAPGSKLLSNSAFVTKGGIAGVKLAYNTIQQGKSLRQVFYLVPAKNKRMLAITASSMGKDGLKYDSDVDTAVRNLVKTK